MTHFGIPEDKLIAAGLDIGLLYDLPEDIRNEMLTTQSFGMDSQAYSTPKEQITS